jgi:hypothetical protein
MSAANFIIFGRIINLVGPQYSRISPKYCNTLSPNIVGCSLTTFLADTLVFIIVDVAALIVQAVGGATASRAAQSSHGDPNKGGHIMLIGIVIQMGELFSIA